MSENFGRVLKEARKQRGMTQAETAAALGCATRTVVGYERGDHWPTEDTIRELVALFGPETFLTALMGALAANEARG